MYKNLFLTVTGKVNKILFVSKRNYTQENRAKILICSLRIAEILKSKSIKSCLDHLKWSLKSLSESLNLEITSIY